MLNSFHSELFDFENAERDIIKFYLMGQLILFYLLEGYKRQQILDLFVSRDNPEGITLRVLDNILESVLGGPYYRLRDFSITILFEKIILESNPKKLVDIWRHNANWLPYGHIAMKIKQLLQDNFFY